MDDTALFDWMEREQFGCWHDARTQKWVSMAGCRFDTPRDAIRAAITYRGATKRPVCASDLNAKRPPSENGGRSSIR